MLSWGHDKKAGDVIILGDCSLQFFYLWKMLQGDYPSTIKDKCFRDYSVIPTEETRFHMCFREERDKHYLHIAPAIGIDAEEKISDEAF